MSMLSTQDLESAISAAKEKGDALLEQKNSALTRAHATQVSIDELAELGRQNEFLTKLSDFLVGPEFGALLEIDPSLAKHPAEFQSIKADHDRATKYHTEQLVFLKQPATSNDDVEGRLNAGDGLAAGLRARIEKLVTTIKLIGA